MPESLTPSQRLAEVVLGRSLTEYVSTKRAAVPRWSWRMIADQLAEDTTGQVTVSGEILRVWYADSERAAS